MKISRVGEFGAILRIAGLCRKPGREVAVGIGDDSAVYKAPEGRLALAASDMLVEGVHFDLSFTGFQDLGYKALAVNLSDIAAMGGRPRYYLVSLALPGGAEMEDLEALYRGMESAAEPHGVRLIGGDTSGSPGPAVVSVTVLGDAAPGRVVKRSGAKPGDDLYVTGFLGDSAGGLELLKAGVRGQGSGVKGQDFGFRISGFKSAIRNQQSAIGYLVSRHLKPAPRVAAGRLLAEGGLVTSMIDVSDGLSSDLRHIIRQSGVGAVVFKDRLPLSEEAVAVMGVRKARKLALHGGEDYELLFTARPDKRNRIAGLQGAAGTTFTLIGGITGDGGAVLAEGKGVRRSLKPKGYEHFRK